MTRGTGERIYRACQRCRERKSKCDLTSIGESGRPPCLECFRTGHDCNLAGSRRGGDYTSLRKLRSTKRLANDTSTQSIVAVSLNVPSMDQYPILTSVDESIADNSQNNESICSELKNPHDALEILAKVAVNDSESTNDTVRPPEYAEGGYHPAIHEGIALSNRPQICAQGPSLNVISAPGIKDYELVRSGALEVETIINLIHNYLVNYHPFVPLARKDILSPLNIDEMAAKESFLLTAILTIASKDDPNLAEIHKKCWENMKQLLLNVLLGHPSTQEVGSVEGLLLLSDWVPDIQFDRATHTGISRGKISISEDSTAWSLVGQAVRQAYLLKLDRTSFRNECFGESKDQVDRKRLVWIFVYLADRQISVRMGQSFWSRGPSLSTKFTMSDFPSLQPASDAEDDYASVLQATIELTQLLHNMHDILYSSKTRTMEMMQMGDYSRYLDDFLKALSAWYELWGALKLSPKLKSSLQLTYEYLCLYVNAFSFQSVISREFTSSKMTPPSTLSNHQKHSKLFPSGVMASPDGRFVFEAIRAAKMILKEFIDMDATSVLRYMPSRFYLYGIYSAVFLNRADMFGALNMKEERMEIVKLVRGFMLALEVAATSEHHIGLRYSKLLRGLWFPSIGQTRPEVPQQIVSQISPHNIPPSNRESTEALQGLLDPEILETSQNLGAESSLPNWLDGSGFDPFCGSFSYFEADIFGMLSQKDFDSDMPVRN